MKRLKPEYRPEYRRGRYSRGGAAPEDEDRAAGSLKPTKDDTKWAIALIASSPLADEGAKIALAEAALTLRLRLADLRSGRQLGVKESEQVDRCAGKMVKVLDALRVISDVVDDEDDEDDE